MALQIMRYGYIYRGKEFNFSKHYAIMPDMHFKYLIYQRNIQKYQRY